MDLKLSDKELNYALFGLIYGDGHYRDGWINITHSKQKFYVNWLVKFCKLNNLRYTVRYDVKSKGTFGSYIRDKIYIKVKDRRHFDKFGRIYNSKTGKREVSGYVLNRLSTLSLLFWYLDDGSLCVRTKENKTNRFIHLATHAFSYDDNVKIQSMFKKRFDIDTLIHKEKGLTGKTLYRIYINATNTRKFFEVISSWLQFVPIEFNYKFNMKYVPNRLKASVWYSERYNGLLKLASDISNRDGDIVHAL